MTLRPDNVSRRPDTIIDAGAWTAAELLDAALAKLGCGVGTWTLTAVCTDGVARRVALKRGDVLVLLDRPGLGLQSEVS